MGKYINGIGTTFTEKVVNLKLEYNATETDASFKNNLVCVVDNGLFAAASYIYSEQEFSHFNENDGRNKTWLIVPNAADLAS